jgi:hypothetical protein
MSSFIARSLDWKFIISLVPFAFCSLNRLHSSLSPKRLVFEWKLSQLSLSAGYPLSKSTKLLQYVKITTLMAMTERGIQHDYTKHMLQWRLVKLGDEKKYCTSALQNRVRTKCSFCSVEYERTDCCSLLWLRWCM